MPLLTSTGRQLVTDKKQTRVNMSFNLLQVWKTGIMCLSSEQELQCEEHEMTTNDSRWTAIAKKKEENGRPHPKTLHLPHEKCPGSGDQHPYQHQHQRSELHLFDRPQPVNMRTPSTGGSKQEALPLQPHQRIASGRRLWLRSELVMTEEREHNRSRELGLIHRRRSCCYFLLQRRSPLLFCRRQLCLVCRCWRRIQGENNGGHVCTMHLPPS